MSPAVLALLVALSSLAQNKPPDPLAQARQLYNDGRYDEAIRRAGEAMGAAPVTSAAALIAARARLERYRQSGEPADLDAARTTLKRVVADVLSPRDHVDLMVALGELMYLDEQYGPDDRFSAAAEQFEIALAHGDLLDAKSRDLLFDWWAGALDRQAQQDEAAARRAVYARIQKGAERELARDAEAASASYWLAASARGVEDLTRAIGAASAAWTRASTLGDRGVALRADLDRLMRNVILPERARELSRAANDNAKEMLASLEAQWQRLTDQWKVEDKED